MVIIGYMLNSFVHVGLFCWFFMFAVGHMSLAYLLGAFSSKFLKVNPNIPALMVLSILPDIDIAIETFTGLSLHRGPTHSVFFTLIIFAPFLIIYGKRTVPYFLAYVSHFLIGDFFIGGRLQLFWPLLKDNFGFFEAGFLYINIYSIVNIAVEFSLLFVAIVVLAKTRDYHVFFSGSKSNLVLVIPIVTVLLPTFIGYPFSAPLFVFLPLIGLAHLFFLTLFGVSILKVVYVSVKKRF
ncbi:MAG: metal-dependent hydrolase [Candidatus Bathyarchaeota archaeon]|nr:metal-dependent hydrolase [Candidatus Termiticorpusculum sp.]